MKKIVLILTLLGILTGCGEPKEYPYYKVSQVEIKPIVAERIPNCPCKLYKETNQVNANSEVGISLTFNKEFYRLAKDSSIEIGTSYVQGKLGCREKIVEIRVLILGDKGSNTDITNEFYNDQDCIDNSDNRYVNYPEENRDMNCHHKDSAGRYFTYHSYKLIKADTSNYTNQFGKWFSIKMKDGTYLEGWDLYDDSLSYEKNNDISWDIDHFINSFNNKSNWFKRQGQESIKKTFWLKNRNVLKGQNKLKITVKFSDGKLFETILDIENGNI